MIVEENILDGRQLINLRLKENRDLPIVGQKEFQPSNSWLEKKQIQCALADRKALLEEQRVEKSNALSCAEWIPDVKKAKVTKKTGKLWENFGHHVDDADWLFPEEALLFLETNTLELFLNEVPLSIERSYVTLLNKETGCTLNEYRVYSHLARLGYRLFRHLAEVSVTRYEKEINLDQHVLRQKRTYNTNINTDCIDTGNITVDIVDKNNDISDALSRDCDFSNISCDVTIEHAEPIIEKQSGSEVRSLQDKERAGEVIQIEPEESLNSSDVLSVTSKAPTNKSDVVPVREDICIDEDDDDDVVEIPISKEIVIVNDVSDDEAAKGSDKESASSDSDDDDSVVSQRSNSNWKRRANELDNIIDVSESPPLSRYAIRMNYVTFNEFLYDPTQTNVNKSNANDDDKEDEVIELSDDENATSAVTEKPGNILGKEIERFYKEIEVIDIDSEPEDANDSVSKNNDVVKLTKKDILDMLPNLKNGVLNVIKVPPANLLPPNVKPSRNEYKLVFSTTDSYDNDRNRNRNNYRNNYNSGNYNNNNSNFFNSNRGGNSFSNNNGPLFYVKHVASKGRPDFQFQKMNNRSSFYYNQNRPRFSDNGNVSWAQPWHMNSIQNQVSQIRDMATGMMHVASSLLSLPFVQQSLTNINMPSLFGINQSFQQAAARMPGLYDSNQPYQNQVNAVVPQQPVYGSRFNNFGNNQMYNNSLLGQPSNVLVYNSSNRQQLNSVPQGYANSTANNNNNSCYNNFDSNLQRENYNQRASNNFTQTFNEQNDCRSPQKNNSPNFSSRETSRHNVHTQNMNRKRSRWSDSYSQSNNPNQRNHGDKANENDYRQDNGSGSKQNDEPTRNQNNINDVDDSSDHNNQDGFSKNNSNREQRMNSRERRRVKRRFYVDRLPEFSVLNDDIDVSSAALAIDSSDDFIPFSDSCNDNRNLSVNRNRNDYNSHFIDSNSSNQVVVDDGSNYSDGNRRFVNRNHHGYYNHNRGRKPWYNRNRRPNWRSNFNSSNNKRPRIDNEPSGSVSSELRHIVDESRNIPKDCRSTVSNDNIVIIEDTSGNETARKNIELKKKRAANRKKNVKRSLSDLKSSAVSSRLRRQKLKNKLFRNNKNKNQPIEVIDIDIDEPVPNVKSEKTNEKTSIKLEKSKENRITNNDHSATTNNITPLKREGLEDEASVNSVFSNSCISINSTNSSSIVKTEPSTSTVKKESTLVKQETSSIAITTSVSSVTSSATETTVLTTTTATVISVKLEENAGVKSEKSIENNKDITVTVTENVTNDSVTNILKKEKPNEISQALVKHEKSPVIIQNLVRGTVTMENSSTVADEFTVNSKSAANMVSSIGEKIIDNSEISGRECDKGTCVPVPTTLSGTVERGRSERLTENVEAEVLSWAQLKRKSSVTVTAVDEESRMSVESVNDDDDEAEEGGEELEEDEDEEQVRPILRAEDCKSIKTVLSALQIIGTADLSCTAQRKLKISYDVYIPSATLKKSCRGLPNYRLVIMSFRDEVPNPGEMAELSSRFEDGVPILIGVVSPDSVSFFVVSTVKLPTDDSL